MFNHLSLLQRFCLCFNATLPEKVVDPVLLCDIQSDIKQTTDIISIKQMESDTTSTIDYSFLDSVKYADTKQYIPDVSFGKVVKVYDGDTITIANRISIGNTHTEQIYRFQVRLSGIDTPEIKTKNEATKALAIKVRDALSAIIFGKIVHLKNVSHEKFGRLLADVYLDDIHINQWLIDNQYAVKYDGGTKHIPEEWES
jgi:micrococcal nuclease